MKVLNYFSILLFLSACTQPIPSKHHPEYVGVDPKVQTLVDEYMWLSKQNHVEFKHKVTIGFKVINEGAAVGLTSFGWSFREIDIDSTYWDHATKTSRMALVFHELTHAYCGRDHDYGNGTKYPDTEEKRIHEAMEWVVKGGPRPGYWDDGCAVSLMYPVVLEDDCILEHYQEYTKEMFDRCDAY